MADPHPRLEARNWLVILGDILRGDRPKSNGPVRPSRNLGWGVSAFAGGLAAVAQFSTLPPSWLIGLTAAVAVLLSVCRIAILPWFLLGLAWASGHAVWRMADELPHSWEQTDLRIVGTISGIPDRREDGLRFDFAVRRVLEPADARVPHRIRLNWYHTDERVKAGDQWAITVRLKRPHGYFNSGGLDYEQWLFLQRIRATGYVREHPKAPARLESAAPWHPASWRQQVYDRLFRSLSWSPLGGIIIALTMGEEGDITPTQWDVLRRTGTAHLVAVSGSHIGLIAGIAFLLVRRLCGLLMIRRWSPPTVAAMASLLVAIGYSALAGFSVPTQRAVIMIAVVMVGVVGRRNVRPFHTFWLALLAVGLWDPFAVLAPGFWLSFAAVAIILLDLGYRLRSPAWVLGICRINWITAIGLAPFLLLFFQQVSLVSPVANLLAVPTLGMVGIPFALTSLMALTVFPPLGAALLTFTEQWVQDAWLCLEGLSQIPLAQWIHARPPAWTMVFAVPGALLLIAPRGVPARWLGLVLWLPAVLTTPLSPSFGAMRLNLLDVGQGLAAVVQTQNHVLVFDTGARFSEHFDMGSAVIEPYLRSQGLNRLDMLVVSHGDNDHIGGAETLIGHWHPRAILTSVPERMEGSFACAAGQSWRWDGVDFQILGPMTRSAKDNDNSCVLKVSAGRTCFLLTGDIESPAEQQLAERFGGQLRCELLVAPHHGSKTSSSKPFLDQVKPRFVLIPAGYLNRYGFPHAQVIERYRQGGAMVFDSATAGAITTEIVPNSRILIPRAYRADAGRFWTDR